MIRNTTACFIIVFLLVNASGCSKGSTTIEKQPEPPVAHSSTIKQQISSTPVTNQQTTTTPTPFSSQTGLAVSPEKVKEAEQQYEKGYELYNEFKYDEAIKRFNLSIEADPTNYKAYNGKGIALCFKGDYKTGMDLIRKSLDMKHDYPYANFNMAMAYKLQKDLSNALLWFEKTLSFDSNDTWSYYGISTIYADWGNTEKSLEYLKKAIELDPAVKGVAKGQSHYDKMRNNPEFIKLTK